jgi:hypothetical protein
MADVATTAEDVTARNYRHDGVTALKAATS